jgi:5-formyltetrahydrofolate cyclo-ligase
MDIKKVKHEIRTRVWNLLEEKRVARFPLPLNGRIPNFVQAEKAGEFLTELEEWKRAKV